MRLVFAFCFFHAICQDRRKFGPIGWNIAYNFTPEDLVTNRRQLKYFLDHHETIPYKVLQFLGAKINYGGRVTDKKDKILIETMIKIFICEDLVEGGSDYKFSNGGLFYCPAATCQDEFLAYLRDLPLTTPPEVFGMHENCEMTCAESEAICLLEDVLSLSTGGGGGGGGGGKSPEDIMDETAVELIAQTPTEFDLDAFEEKFPTMYEESRNTVALQEAVKYNRLLSLLKVQLPLFRRAVKGLVVMSPELDDVSSGILSNSVPSIWKKVSYPSLKPVTSYVNDLAARLAFLQEWVDQGIPVCFWISGFFFTQSFLTGQLQNYARKFTLPIDTLIWTFKVLKRSDKDFTKPQTGCLIYGLFMDGARWDDTDQVIAESLPKVLFDSIPHIHVVPCESAKDQTDRKTVYMAPVYKTSERKGTLSTTGHSTNFVMPMLIPIAKQHNEKYWAKRGVACLTQLDV
jgi:dynein heavy chain